MRVNSRKRWLCVTCFFFGWLCQLIHNNLIKEFQITVKLFEIKQRINQQSQKKSSTSPFSIDTHQANQIVTFPTKSKESAVVGESTKLGVQHHLTID